MICDLPAAACKSAGRGVSLAATTHSTDQCCANEQHDVQSSMMCRAQAPQMSILNDSDSDHADEAEGDTRSESKKAKVPGCSKPDKAKLLRVQRRCAGSCCMQGHAGASPAATSPALSTDLVAPLCKSLYPLFFSHASVSSQHRLIITWSSHRAVVSSRRASASGLTRLWASTGPCKGCLVGVDPCAACGLFWLMQGFFEQGCCC